MMERILFYSTINAYGELSNFAEYPIMLDGKSWPTTEHYFQAKKFPGTPHEEEIRGASSPNTAARMGRQRTRPLRADWEGVKEEVMMVALRAKFTQHPELGELLIGTGDAELVEHTRNDHYWADGGDGSGKNRLGALLMELRAELVGEQAAR
jgi:N-glycosidase YbiA